MRVELCTPVLKLLVDFITYPLSFSFDGLGFGLAFTASFLSGARWTFSQKVLQVLLAFSNIEYQLGEIPTIDNLPKNY